MILAFIFMVFSIFAIKSQLEKYQRLNDCATNSVDPDEIKSYRSAQNKMIPNLVILIIGLIGNILILIFLFYFQTL